MSVPVIIIVGGPRPGAVGTRLNEDRKEFPSVHAAIEYLKSLPPSDELPSGDGTSES